VERERTGARRLGARRGSGDRGGASPRRKLLVLGGLYLFVLIALLLLWVIDRDEDRGDAKRSDAGPAQVVAADATQILRHSSDVLSPHVGEKELRQVISSRGGDVRGHGPRVQPEERRQAPARHTPSARPTSASTPCCLATAFAQDSGAHRG
jgi:hypothetical protein